MTVICAKNFKICTRNQKNDINHEEKTDKVKKGIQMKLKSIQLIVNDNGGIVMGTGRMIILESIERTNSINQTAKELKMSYKTAWSKIKSTQKNFGKPIVIADKKKGTKLTQDGKALLEQYRQLKKRCIKADDVIFEDIFSNQE
ncbi:winged helix-turn-helix domain-containing protein [Desulfobacula phenolica]|uniref:Molybdate transport system regulatory protein n=1 Tax=Desulfobacula phenolica TaxID=90732 RepID=A0A1H2K1J8_9BACT|nr:LysR family transcriptional regulator [Desulfobacula phenolica]SDU62288.1 molybdate transport system regulatory protein [Desulfobacula phenolica]